MLEATLSSLASLLAAPDLGPALLAALTQKIPFSVGLLRLLTAGLKQDKFKGSPQVSGNYILYIYIKHFSWSKYFCSFMKYFS